MKRKQRDLSKNRHLYKKLESLFPGAAVAGKQPLVIDDDDDNNEGGGEMIKIVVVVVVVVKQEEEESII